MWTLLALCILAILIVMECFYAMNSRNAHPERTAQLTGKAMTPLELLVNSKAPTTSEVLLSLLSHDVLVVLWPPEGTSPQSTMRVFQDDQGPFVLATTNSNVLAALQTIDQNSPADFTAQPNPGLEGILKYVGRMSGENLLLKCPPDLTIRLLLRTTKSDFIHKVAIDAAAIAAMQACKPEV